METVIKETRVTIEKMDELIDAINRQTEVLQELRDLDPMESLTGVVSDVTADLVNVIGKIDNTLWTVNRK